MKSLKEPNRCVAITKKLNAIIDCASSYPKVKGNVHSEQSIKKSLVYTDFINQIDSFPNVYGVMKSSNINFSNKSSLKKLFLDNAMRRTNEIHFSSNIMSEGKCDGIGFGIDADCEGNQRPLTRKSDVLVRTQPIILERSLQEKLRKWSRN